MPVSNAFSGIWSFGIDYGLGNLPFVVQNADQGYDLSISPVDLMSGAGPTLTRDYDTFDAKFSIDGPVLFEVVEDTATPPPWNLELLNPASARYYSMLVMWSHWASVYTPSSYFSSSIMDSFSFNVSNNSSCSASWFSDPPVQSYGPGHFSIINDLNAVGLPPIYMPAVRSASWYDFITLVGGYALNAKSFQLDMNFDYEMFKPLGGTDAFMLGSAIDAGTYDHLMHTPVRFLQSYKASASITLIAMLNNVAPWGGALPWEAPILGTSVQKHDLGIYESEVLDLAFLVDGFSAIMDFFPWYPMGINVNSVSTKYQPGLSEITMNIDYIAPL